MRAKEKLYLETTVVSYYVSRPSKDLVTAADQLVTREFWIRRLPLYEVYVSEIVIDEAEKGDRTYAAERLKAIAAFPVISQSNEVRELAKAYMKTHAFPRKAELDAFRLAAASIQEVGILATWNCRHLANPKLWRKFAENNRVNGLELPVICTPRVLLGE